MSVSSRGASKAFIVAVYCRILKSNIAAHLEDRNLTWPFPPALAQAWVNDAEDDMTEAGESGAFGGVAFVSGDTSTYWTLSSHFFTWHKNNIERTAKFGVTLAIANAPERENNKEKRLLHCVLARLVKNIQALSSAGRSDNPKLFSLDVPGFTVPAFLAARLAEWPVALEAGPPPMLTSTSAAVFKPAPAVKSKAPHSAETGGERRPERARPSKSRRVVSPLSAAAAAASASSSYYYSSSSSYSSSAAAAAAAAAAAGPQFESFESAPFLSLITTEVGPLDEAWSSVVSPFPFSLSISTDEATGRHWGVCSPAGRGAPSLLLDIDDQALDAIMSLSPSMYLLSPPKSAKPQDGHHNGLGLDTILSISPALLLSPPKSATAPQQQQQPQHMGTLPYLAAAAALRV